MLDRLLGPSTTGENAVRDKFVDAHRFTETEDPLILDGGAHRGESIERIQEEWPNSRIVAFEANPRLAELLEDKYATSAVDVFDVALGSEQGNMTLNVTENDMSSSFREPTETNREAFGEGFDIEEQVEVEVRRADECVERPPDVIKLDLQGAELQALRGCENWLNEVGVVIMEVSFRELYHGQPRFSDVLSYMGRHEFEFFNLYETWTSDDGWLAEADALFVREE